MNIIIKYNIIKGYANDIKFVKVLKDFINIKLTDNGIIYCPGYPFIVMEDGLIYNIRGRERYLYILYLYVREILAVIYDEKYYFNRDKILYDLWSIAINNKIYFVKKYV